MNDSIQQLIDMNESFITSFVGANKDEIVKRIVPEIEKEIQEKFGFIPQVHEIKMPNKTITFKECVHEKFEEVLQIVSLNIPVYLTGKAGTGKNVICQQVAKALGLEFYSTSTITQEYKLTGFKDANGIYQSTEFYNAFTKGGLFFLDEIDASIPEVLIILNGAIANRYFDFPNGRIDAHPNFRVIAAGNTTGLGADNNYTGRFCLDRASLDRFAMINIDYSLEIEKNMSKGKYDLVQFTHAFRESAEKVGVECIFSYRSIHRIATLEEVFPDLSEVLEISLLKGLPKEDIKIICEELYKHEPMRNNKYARCLILKYTDKISLSKQSNNKNSDLNRIFDKDLGTLFSNAPAF